MRVVEIETRLKDILDEYKVDPEAAHVGEDTLLEDFVLAVRDKDFPRPSDMFTSAALIAVLLDTDRRRSYT